MAAPHYQYAALFSTGNAPDLSQVNAEAQGGWELVQVLVNRPDWAYILRKQATTPGPPLKKKKKK